MLNITHTYVRAPAKKKHRKKQRSTSICKQNQLVLTLLLFFGAVVVVAKNCQSICLLFLQLVCLPARAKISFLPCLARAHHSIYSFFFSSPFSFSIHYAFNMCLSVSVFIISYLFNFFFTSVKYTSSLRAFVFIVAVVRRHINLVEKENIYSLIHSYEL